MSDLLKDNLDSFREGVRQLAAVGRNINQIAHAIPIAVTI
jgi:hypothetical protein